MKQPQCVIFKQDTTNINKQEKMFQIQPKKVSS